jgi:DNA-binding beta-propeller fold protein YncE
MRRGICYRCWLAAAVIVSCWGLSVAHAEDVPRFAVDATWPKPLPNQWILGQIGGIAVDRHDHIWVLQRPRTLTDDERAAATDPPTAKCCRPAPPVLVFDADGNLLSSWGGAGNGYEWPENEHGIFVDQQDNVWIGGNGKADAQVLKFTREGRFLQQMGRSGQTSGSNSPTDLGRPALAIVDPATNELYIADGYGNRRVLVLDAKTGEYKRHWGAYGNRPDDTDLGKYEPGAPRAQQFRTPVHCVRISHDGLVYVCDRVNDRVQVFQKDGKFVTEYVLDPLTRFVGSVWDLVLSEDAEQKYLFVADGTNNEVHILLRANGVPLGTFGRAGRQAGQFHWVHAMAIDSQGNLYTGDVDTGKRVQKFRRVRE